MSLVSKSLHSSLGLLVVVDTCPLNINIKRGEISAIVRDILRNCNMSYFSQTLCAELLICHQITVSLEAVNRMSLRLKTKYLEYFKIRYYSKEFDEIN